MLRVAAANAVAVQAAVVDADAVVGAVLDKLDDGERGAQVLVRGGAVLLVHAPGLPGAARLPHLMAGLKNGDFLLAENRL